MYQVGTALPFSARPSSAFQREPVSVRAATLPLASASAVTMRAEASFIAGDVGE